MEVDKENLQWKEETKETLINSLPEQETNSKAGQKENETLKTDERKQEESEALTTKKMDPKLQPIIKVGGLSKKGKKRKKRLQKGEKIKRFRLKDSQREIKYS
ncbi:uncharacterized protein DS421_3g86190 [Arachis hypogaea]|nr:uncharacterized protein DS421_3g86190 [Arachis hypogaea]